MAQLHERFITKYLFWKEIMKVWSYQYVCVYDVCAYVCLCVCVCVCICMLVCVYDVCAYVCLCMCVCLGMCLHMHVCICRRNYNSQPSANIHTKFEMVNQSRECSAILPIRKFYKLVNFNVSSFTVSSRPFVYVVWQMSDKLYNIIISPVSTSV